jgi:hypothetical protein
MNTAGLWVTSWIYTPGMFNTALNVSNAGRQLWKLMTSERLDWCKDLDI